MEENSRIIKAKISIDKQSRARRCSIIRVLEIRKKNPCLDSGCGLPCPSPALQTYILWKSVFQIWVRLSQHWKIQGTHTLHGQLNDFAILSEKKVYINSMSLSYTICESLKEGGNSVELLLNPLKNQLYIWVFSKRNVLNWTNIWYSNHK